SPRHGRVASAGLGADCRKRVGTWHGVSTALYFGRRGLPGGSSLTRLLAERRGVHHPRYAPLTIAQILDWADAHFRLTGNWPISSSPGVLPDSTVRGRSIDVALQIGLRGLAGGSSLAQLLAEKRRVRFGHRRVPPLSEAAVLGWADACHARTGSWPRKGSGP